MLFPYTRTSPASSGSDTSDTLAALTPTPYTFGNGSQGIEISFTPVADANDPFTLIFPDVEALRDGALLNGFTIPGDRTSGGGGEVRVFAPRRSGGFEAVGQLVPANIGYAPGFGPNDLPEKPNNTIVFLIEPVTPYNAFSLWHPEYEVRLDLTNDFVTTSISYQ